MGKIKIFLAFLTFLFFPFPAFAQTPTSSKVYNYDLINTKITVNKDSTFDVEESQTFNFTGSFHLAFRSIPLHGTDAITDILVTDATKNVNLTYSEQRRDPLDVLSKDYFTYYRNGGNEVIEWYYDLANTTHTWILHYKVHGGIEFNQSSDRLYWNIFTDCSVPVKKAQVEVTLPADFATAKIPVFAYRSVRQPVVIDKSSGHLITFTSSGFAAGEDFTIDVSWPKGVVSRTAYWKDFLKIYYGYIFAAAFFIGSLVTVILFWFFREKLPQGRGTIVPQYSPPEDLRPAMAEVIVKEGLTTKGLTATVIDLAVRGYLKIEEQKRSLVFVYILAGTIGFIVLVVLFKFYLEFPSGDFLRISTLSTVFLTVIILFLVKAFFKSLFPADYVITAVKPYKEDTKLLEYEKSYLSLLLGWDGKFSTKGLRESSNTTKREFYQKTQKIKDEIYKETQTTTNAYQVDLIAEKKERNIWIALVIIVFVIFLGQLEFRIPLNQLEVLILSGGVSFLGLWAYIKYEARLNREGRILKEEWLGFKLYLETAEKYRLQNLTPDQFEKYLPYAMIFGVEKKWAKAFESLNMPPPSWYYGPYGGVHTGGTYSSSSVAGSFSPSGFSASFSSSFSSSFGSSGAGGGGGGGGAGGGGGGGGGGAS